MSLSSHPGNPEQALPLLCERCGYDLTAIRAQSVCPECALAVSESLPEARPGSGWQRAWHHRGALLPVAWLTTGLRGLIVPGRQLRRATIARDGCSSLLFINMTLATILLTARTARPSRELVLSVWPQSLPSPAAWLGPTWPVASTIALFLVWLGLFIFLTEVERLGVRFYSRRRGWRVDRTVSLVATAHASGAWPLAAFLGVLMPLILDRVLNALPASAAFYLVGLRFFAGSTGFIVGMIWFEMSTYFGIRACRYGNPPGVLRPPA